jgi:hypothetical protein
VTILIEPGAYQGQVYVPASKPGLTLAGATGNPASVTLVDDIAHGTIAPNGHQYGTDCSATLSVAGNGFSAYGITVQNSFDPAASPQITSPPPRPGSTRWAATWGTGGPGWLACAARSGSQPSRRASR